MKGLDSTWFQFMGLPCSTCADVLWWAVGWWWAGGRWTELRRWASFPTTSWGPVRGCPKEHQRKKQRTENWEGWVPWWTHCCGSVTESCLTATP